MEFEGYSPYAVVCIAAILAAAAELLTRYRDNPAAAIFSRFGLFYLATNVLMAVLVYAQFGYTIDLKGDHQGLFSQDVALNALGIGIGTMVILRSKVFTLRTESGNEVAFGPAAIVDAFLFAIDREIDRRQAAERHKAIWTCFKDRPLNQAELEALIAFYEMSLLAYQNISSEEKSAVVKLFNEFQHDSQWTPRMRAMAVSFCALYCRWKKAL